MNYDRLIDTCLQSSIPPLLVGPPGCGKTDRLLQAAERHNLESFTVYAWQLDPVDISGLPIPVPATGVGMEGQRRIERLLDDVMAKVFSTPEPMLLILDELGQATPSQQASLAPLLLARRVGRYVLPDHVKVAAATNRRSDKAGASHILSHLISRCALINVEPDLDGFMTISAKRNLHPDILGFLRFRSALLCNFTPELSDMTPYACPRSWEAASRMLFNCAVHDVQETTATVVGNAAASELAAFVSVSRALPDLDKIVDQPHTMALPKDSCARYALASGLSFRCKPETSENILVLAERLYKLKASEFAALLLRDALLRAPGVLQKAEGWSRICNGPLGSAIRGC